MTVADADARSTIGVVSVLRGFERFRRSEAQLASSSAHEAATAARIAKVSRGISLHLGVARSCASAGSRGPIAPIARRGRLNGHHDTEMRARKFAIDELHAAAVSVHEFEHHGKTDPCPFQTAALR